MTWTWLLAGFSGSTESWAPVRPALDRSGHFLAFELPGHGLNPYDGSVESFADRLAREIQDHPGQRPNVLGYSLGARIALRLAVTHPDAVNCLILESPSAGIADPAERAARKRADDELADSIERDGIEAFVDRWEQNPIFATHAALDPTVAAQQRAIRLAQRPRGLAQSLRMAGQGAMEPLHDRLGEVRAATLVIAGALDPARARAEQVALGIPNARLAIVEGAGHTPHLERPIVFARLVISFLQEDAA